MAGLRTPLDFDNHLAVEGNQSPIHTCVAEEEASLYLVGFEYPAVAVAWALYLEILNLGRVLTSYSVSADVAAQILVENALTSCFASVAAVVATYLVGAAEVFPIDFVSSWPCGQHH